GGEVVAENDSQIIGRHLRALFGQEPARPLWYPTKATRRGDPELRQIFARHPQLAAQAVDRGHVVDRPQIYPRAGRLEISQRCEKGVLRGTQWRQVKEMHPA